MQITNAEIVPQRLQLASVIANSSLQWNVGMFLPGVDLLLAGQHLQISAELFTSAWWLDDVIHETWSIGSERKTLNTNTRGRSEDVQRAEETGKFTSDGSREGVGELLHVLGFSLVLIVLASEDDLDGTLRRNSSAPMLNFHSKRD